MAKQRAFANQEREFQARRFGKLGRAANYDLGDRHVVCRFGLTCS